MEKYYLNSATLILTAAFSIFAFYLFYSNTFEVAKSLAAAGLVFFLTWLALTVIRWVYDLF